MWKSEGFIQEMSFTTVQLLLKRLARFFFCSQLFSAFTVTMQNPFQFGFADGILHY
jgi:hypothetical protein